MGYNEIQFDKMRLAIKPATPCDVAIVVDKSSDIHFFFFSFLLFDSFHGRNPVELFVRAYVLYDSHVLQIVIIRGRSFSTS